MWTTKSQWQVKSTSLGLGKYIAKRLLSYRITNNLKQRELARILKVHRATVCRWERCYQLPGGAAILKMLCAGILSFDEVKSRYEWR
jgi:transcriptional regulator with XRE-family HTH domain